MSVTLIVSRFYDRQLNKTDNSIAIEHWLDIIRGDSSLRINDVPSVAGNPKAGDIISVPHLPAQAEIVVNGQSSPFLGYRRGELVMRYSAALEDPNSPVRKKIAEIAQHLGAIIMTDAGDEILDW
jgi:hypothetical protein